jgi:hypothetical protein
MGGRRAESQVGPRLLGLEETMAPTSISLLVVDTIRAFLPGMRNHRVHMKSKTALSHP